MTRRFLGYRRQRAGFALAGAVALLLTIGLSTNVRTQAGQTPAPAAPATSQTPAPTPTPEAGGFITAGRGNLTSPNSDYAPKEPYLPRSAAEEAKGFILPVGYRMELVKSDPEVISPVVIEFDGNGRMYVVEMISYMMDAGASREHDPISRISRWESTKGDGVYDKKTVFVDKVVAPRMILPLQDGVILTSETDSDDLVKWTDTNGDGVADKREVVFTGIGQSGDPTTGSTRPTTPSGSAGRRTASCASRPVRTAASGASPPTMTASRGSWMRAASAAR
jgi:hypothetical protein